MPTKEITCDPNAVFRSIDGTCNNLRNPSFGAINTQFNRLLAADYGDGISTLRRGVYGQELPNARDVSRMVHGSNADRSNPNSTQLSHLAMNFGQFMDHDTTLAAFENLNCEPPTQDPECINIEIPKDDATFRKRGVDFIEMERDAHIKRTSFCKLVPREHTNTITAFIDASNVYGSTKKLADSLRAKNGLLKDLPHPDGMGLASLLPPQPEESEEFCPSLDRNRPCFLSGDIRNNENQGRNTRCNVKALLSTLFIPTLTERVEDFAHSYPLLSTPLLLLACRRGVPLYKLYLWVGHQSVWHMTFFILKVTATFNHRDVFRLCFFPSETRVCHLSLENTGSGLN